jgi:hypothetical protein
MTDSRVFFSMLFLFVGLTLPRCGRGQGTVYFTNAGAPGAVRNGLTGQGAEAGTTFSVTLYFAQDGIIDAAQLLQIGPAIHMNGSPGYFGGGIYTAPTLTPGGYGMFQVRVWETSFGSTFEQAVANTTPQNGRLALAGESGILRVWTSYPFADPPLPPAPLVGWPAVVGSPLSDGFVLNVVPEPGSFLILLFALPLLALGHRRRR